MYFITRFHLIRTKAWELKLHDSVLSLCAFQDGASFRVFAGLADGTVAVLEVICVNRLHFS